MISKIIDLAAGKDKEKGTFVLQRNVRVKRKTSRDFQRLKTAPKNHDSINCQNLGIFVTLETILFAHRDHKMPYELQHPVVFGVIS